MTNDPQNTGEVVLRSVLQSSMGSGIRSSNTLLVTSLRNPIARALSSYRFGKGSGVVMVGVMRRDITTPHTHAHRGPLGTRTEGSDQCDSNAVKHLD